MDRPPVSTRTEAYVRRRARATMRDSVRVLRPGASSMDPTTLRITAGVPTTIYEGVAKVATLSGSSIIVGESVQSTSSTQVSVPYDAPIAQIDDVVLVLDHKGDDELVSDAFVVKDVGGGGLLRAVRVLTCMTYQASRWWE